MKVRRHPETSGRWNLYVVVCLDLNIVFHLDLNMDVRLDLSLDAQQILWSIDRYL